MDREALSRAVTGLHELVARLRGPGGCPWDAEQTEDTVKMYLLEEAYEVLDAVERGTAEGLCHELGDLFFQILFLCRLAEEKGEFDFQKVVEEIHRKMIHRHPHVFGSLRVSNSDEVAENWREIKKKEKAGSGAAHSPIEGVPAALPALLRAHRLKERLSGKDAVRVDHEQAWKRVEEGVERLRQGLASEEREKAGEEMGDLLLELADLARTLGFNGEHLLRMANRRFLDRLRGGG